MSYPTRMLPAIVAVMAACGLAMANDEHGYDHPPGNGDQPLRVRKSVDSLTPSEIESLRRGVEVMRSRPAGDRTSWSYWANIHGVPGTPSDPLWDQCEHGTLHFFTWHRAYLYYFEQVLREASGDPALTLPYWDWSTNRQVPSIYRSPTGTAMNPLFDENRQMNNGGFLSTFIVINDRDIAFAATGFATFSSRLEGSPHGTVHTSVGGFGGTMSRIDTSANDPIFWAHHANIDRLWNRWLELGNGRTNPGNPAFLNREFTFVDVDGNDVTIRVADLLDQTALGYQYDDDPAPGEESPMRPSRLLATSAPRGNGDAASAPPKPLGLEPEIVELSVLENAAEPLQSVIEAAGPQAERRLLIDVVGIQFNEIPAYVYGVFLNLPGDAEEEQAERYYVGSISFFAREHEHGHEHEGGAQETEQPQSVRFTETLDATTTAARLREAGISLTDNPTVTLRPITVTPPSGQEEAAAERNAASAQEAKVTYQRIELRTSP